MNTEPKKDNFDFFMGVISLLAKSQGFYGRLLSEVRKNQEKYKEYINNKAPVFKDNLDVVMWLEG